MLGEKNVNPVWLTLYVKYVSYGNKKDFYET